MGFGVGGASVIAPLYITELAPTASRGRCIAINAFFIPFGQTVAAALGAAFHRVPKGWRILCGFDWSFGRCRADRQLLWVLYLRSFSWRCSSSCRSRHEC